MQVAMNRISSRGLSSSTSDDPSTPAAPQSSTGPPNDQMRHLEAKISELTLTVQKQERDIAYKEEEIRQVKNIARECAE